MDVKRMIVMLALPALAACGAQPEPAEGPVPAGERPVVIDMTGAATPSIRGLIGERQRLGLTGAQVTTLDSIAIVLSAANDSLRRAVREEWGEVQPRPGSERWDRTQPALAQIGQNNRAAGTLVQNLLTDDQRRIACEIQEEQRARNPQPVRMAPPGSRRIGGRARASADSATLRRGPSGWAWCPAPATPPRR